MATIELAAPPEDPSSRPAGPARATAPAPPAVSTTRDLFKGRLFLLVSALAFAGMGLATRMVPEGINSYEKVFYRSLIGTVVLVGWFLAARGEPLGRPRNMFGLGCRGIFGAVSLLCFFYSIDTIGLARATLYCYTYPVFAAVFAWMDLGERPTRATAGALAVAFIGAVLTLDSSGWAPRFSSGDIAGLFSGLMSGAAVTSIRRLTRTDRSGWIVLAFTFTSTLLAAPFITGASPVATPETATSLLAVGLFAIAAQITLTRGLRHVPAVEGGILSLATVPLSAVAAMLVLNEVLHLRFWLGATLILSASALITLAPSRAEVVAKGSETNPNV